MQATMKTIRMTRMAEETAMMMRFWNVCSRLTPLSMMTMFSH